MQKLNEWLTLFSNLAVLAGILLLAYEIQQNTDSLQQNSLIARAQVYQARADSRMEYHRELSESEVFAPIVMKLEAAGWPDELEPLDTLTDLERYRLKQSMFSSLVRFDNSFYQYRLGLMDEDAWNLSTGRIAELIPTWRRLDMMHGATEPFQEEIAKLEQTIGRGRL